MSKVLEDKYVLLLDRNRPHAKVEVVPTPKGRSSSRQRSSPRQTVPISHPTQLSAPKTVEWLGRYAQFRGNGPICPGRGGGGCMGTT
jgi:hypothetical protein